MRPGSRGRSGLPLFWHVRFCSSRSWRIRTARIGFLSGASAALLSEPSMVRYWKARCSEETGTGCLAAANIAKPLLETRAISKMMLPQADTRNQCDVGEQGCLCGRLGARRGAYVARLLPSRYSQPCPRYVRQVHMRLALACPIVFSSLRIYRLDGIHCRRRGDIARELETARQIRF